MFVRLTQYNVLTITVCQCILYTHTDYTEWFKLITKYILTNLIYL